MPITSTSVAKISPRCNRSTARSELFGTEGAVSNREISCFVGGEFHRNEVDAIPKFSHSDNIGLYFYHEIEHFAGDVYQLMRILDGLYDSAQMGEKIIRDTARHPLAPATGQSSRPTRHPVHRLRALDLAHRQFLRRPKRPPMSSPA